MKCDVVLKDVDVPNGYEVTGEYRWPEGDSMNHEPVLCFNCGDGRSYVGTHSCLNMPRIILRRKEPTAIKACRTWLRFADTTSGVCPAQAIGESLVAIREYEESLK